MHIVLFLICKVHVRALSMLCSCCIHAVSCIIVYSGFKNSNSGPCCIHAESKSTLLPRSFGLEIYFFL